MPKKVRIPTPLRKLTNNEEVVEVSAANIGDAIVELQTRFPGIKERLVDEKGEVRRFVNVYVNDDDVRFEGVVNPNEFPPEFDYTNNTVQAGPLDFRASRRVRGRRR